MWLWSSQKLIFLVGSWSPEQEWSYWTCDCGLNKNEGAEQVVVVLNMSEAAEHVLVV
jgi:hypothetical protein